MVSSRACTVAGQTSPAKQSVNLVLETGGVKLIAMVGALTELEKKYDFALMAGTSAGAMVAALLGAGYTAMEIKSMIDSPEAWNITAGPKIPILDRLWPLDRVVDVASKVYNVAVHLGYLDADAVFAYIRRLLEAKGVRKFRDLLTEEAKNLPLPEAPTRDVLLRRYRIHLVAADLTRRRVLLLPDDMNYEEYGCTPDELDVGLAVQMSCAMPYVFRPVVLTGYDGVKSYIVDGAVMSTFPIRLFNFNPVPPGGKPRLETIDIRITQAETQEISGIWSEFVALFTTVFQAHDLRVMEQIERGRDTRTQILDIPTYGVDVFDFGLSAARREMLHDSGANLAKKLMGLWAHLYDE
jgi:NTE family protein